VSSSLTVASRCASALSFDTLRNASALRRNSLPPMKRCALASFMPASCSTVMTFNALNSWTCEMVRSGHCSSGVPSGDCSMFF
jgi:hypothetical protein